MTMHESEVTKLTFYVFSKICGEASLYRTAFKLMYFKSSGPLLTILKIANVWLAWILQELLPKLQEMTIFESKETTPPNFDGVGEHQDISQSTPNFYTTLLI